MKHSLEKIKLVTGTDVIEVRYHDELLVDDTIGNLLGNVVIGDYSWPIFENGSIEDSIERIVNNIENESTSPTNYIKFLERSDLYKTSKVISYNDLIQHKCTLTECKMGLLFLNGFNSSVKVTYNCKDYHFKSFRDIDLSQFVYIYSMHHTINGYTIVGVLKHVFNESRDKSFENNGEVWVDMATANFSELLYMGKVDGDSVDDYVE